MFQKRMQRTAVVLLIAALLLTAPLQAAGWTTREAPGLLETAWGWLVEWVIGTSLAEPALRSTADAAVSAPPSGQQPRSNSCRTFGDDGICIDPDGQR
jgi:hypothetical protein